MSMIGKYQSLTRGVLVHPLEFYSSMVELNLKFNRQQLELYSRLLGLGNKEFEALSHTNQPEQLAEDQKGIYADIQDITKTSAENVIEAVYQTVDIMDRLSEKDTKRPRSRVTRSAKTARSKPAKA